MWLLLSGLEYSSLVLLLLLACVRAAAATSSSSSSYSLHTYLHLSKVSTMETPSNSESHLPEVASAAAAAEDSEDMLVAAEDQVASSSAAATAEDSEDMLVAAEDQVASSSAAAAAKDCEDMLVAAQDEGAAEDGEDKLVVAEDEVVSSAAAAEASRRGVGRLFMLAARRELSAIAEGLPPPPAAVDGALQTRAIRDTFHAALLGRIVDSAFSLDGDAPIPRHKAAFDAQLSAGIPRLEGLSTLWSQRVIAASLELDKTLAALKTAGKHPSGRAAIIDLEAQIAALFPADLIAWIPVARLERYPRYLRAAQTRLTRAVTDPRKDAEKLAPVAALWSSFVAKQRHAREDEAGDVREIRWLFEELRVAVFAPELKTPVPVSVKRVSEMIAALGQRRVW